MKHRICLSLAALLALVTKYAVAATLVLQTAITPTATAYVSGNCLGPAGASAIIALAGAASGTTGGSLLQSITVTDGTGQDSEIDFLVFKAAPTGTYTDHAACQVTAGDAANWIGTVKVTGYTTYGTPGQANSGQNAYPMNNGSTTTGDIWIIPVVIGTPTYGVSAHLYFNFGVLPDGTP